MLRLYDGGLCRICWHRLVSCPWYSSPCDLFHRQRFWEFIPRIVNCMLSTPQHLSLQNNKPNDKLSCLAYSFLDLHCWLKVASSLLKCTHAFPFKHALVLILLWLLVFGRMLVNILYLVARHRYVAWASAKSVTIQVYDRLKRLLKSV